ncbi:MAG: tRNA preQ1(34) S-adenosylmethionine ribosyltransferase-isomerase QueA [Myxococcota bacterium]
MAAEAARADPLAAYDFELPPERIAQHPLPERDLARLLVLPRGEGPLQHASVRDLGALLRPGDLLVVNESRVIPARLRGRKASGGAAEALLLGPPDAVGRCRALLRTRGRLRVGLLLCFRAGECSVEARVSSVQRDGEVELVFAAGPSPLELGEAPLPPYIRRKQPDPADLTRYQTVYARVPGSVAAPTAGLHFTLDLLEGLARAGVEWTRVVLHVGSGTFRPLRAEQLTAGTLHPERYELSPRCAEAVARTRLRGGRVIAVGTTAARVLEARASSNAEVAPGRGTTDLFLRPGSSFRVIDGLLTNFHLPRSSLLLLVAGFAGRDRVMGAYSEALARGYRFYSYGDAMLVL